MKTFIVIIILLVAIATGPLSAQQRPEVANPISDETFLAISKSDVSAYNIPLKLNSITSVSSVSLAGGNRLVAMQYTDGSWGWPLTAPPTYANIIGPIAMGLAQAYQQTGLSSHRTGLANAGTYLLSKTNNFSPSDGYLAAQLDKIFGVTTYTSHVKTNFYDKLAAGTYDRLGLGTLYTTASYVSKIRTDRANQGIANLAAWDVGMGLVGAAACGAPTADWVAGVKAEINELDGDNYYDVIGLAGAIYGLAYVDEDFDPTAGEHAAASNISDLAVILASYQISGGGFAWNSNYVIPNDGNETIQETGYSILALNEVNRSTYLTNITGAADYMMGVQLGTGGWENYTGYGENNEVTAEALWGISAAYPAPVHNITKDVYYPTIQAAVNDASSGNLIELAATTHPSGGVTITIDKSLTIIGAGEANTFIDVSTNGAAWGIHVKSSDVTMKKFTVIPATAATNGGYPIHVAPEPAIPGSEISNIILQNISVNGSKRTGIDVHGVNNVNISYINSTNATGGNGLQLTGVVGGNLSYITTSGNAWGGVAVYNSGPTLLNRGSSNITFDGTTSSISEINKFYTQADYGLLITNITATGFNYKVRNTSTVPLSAYTWYQITQLNALAFAVALPSPSYSTIQLIADNSWFVGPGLTIGAANNAALSGDLINVAAGTYVEPVQVDIKKNVTLLGASASTTILKPGFNTTLGGNVKSESFIYIDPVATVVVKNFTIDCTGKQVNHAIQSRGALDIEGCIIQNVKYGTYFGRGIVYYGGTSNNLVKNVSMNNIERIGIHVRGNVMTPNPVVNIENFTYVGKGIGNWLDYGIEFGGGGGGAVNNANVSNCKGVASTDGSTSAGILVTDYWGTGTNATILNSHLTNNTTGIVVGYNASDISLVAAHGNVISGNTDYGIYSTNPLVDAAYNDWGSVHGPLDAIGTVEMPGDPSTPVADMKNTIPADKLGNAVSEKVDYYKWQGKNNPNAQGGGIAMGGYVNPTSNDIFAGFDPAASDGIDSRDTVAPPPPPTDYLFLYFLSDPGQPLDKYSCDIKKEEASTATKAKQWDLRAETDHMNEFVTIEFPVAGLPSGFKPTLYELATGKYRNLKDDPFYEYTSPATETPSSFLILIGDSTKPTVAVTSPNGGEYLVVGTPYNITWTSSDASGVLRHYLYFSLTGSAPYNFIDSTNGNVHTYSWTPTTASGTAVIKVVAKDSVMNEEVDISNHTFVILSSNNIAYNAVAGWNLLSVPMQQSDMTPAGVFGDDYGVTPYYTFQYSPSTGYTVPSVLSMGRGYWLGSNSAKTIDAEGTPISTANLNLAAGFNIIGNPFATPLLKNDLRFTDGSLVKNIAESVTAGWLSNILYGYDGTSYYTEGTALGVWKGYWIPMLVNGISILYSPTLSVPTPKTEDVNFTPVHWDVKIIAEMSRDGVQYGDQIASFGVREDATMGFDVMYDAPRPPRSPSQDYVEVIFPVDDEGYPSVLGSSHGRDYRPPDAVKWEFTVKTSTGGIVELKWDNAKIKALPEEVQIILFDKLNCSTIDMKKSGSYTYYQEGTSHQFMINNSSAGIGNEQKYPDTYILAQNYPNPFNPATTISFGLPKASYVTIDIYNSLGQKVSQILSGQMEAGYSTVKFDASHLSSGIYVYRLTANQENVTPIIINKKMILMK